ncbi:unnamed protein product [Phaedon cochleariae]|uniref:Myb/SANT-like DNA-binding domain-containing protein n=1 Tax=Phaedon cochleariae TaxID=80249 RepID=A0A9P0DPB9_PHACE|nr:unnamed protein product [Phaedon cochleariae]
MHNNPQYCAQREVQEIFDVDDQQPTPSSIPGVFMWTVPTTKYFISLYEKYEGGLSSGRITYKMVWDKISKEMRVAGFPVSSKQCSSKLTSLKRMYKAIKEHNSKSGNYRRKWLYYELCDEIFSNKPWMELLSTISSENENVTTSAAIGALEAGNTENSRSSKPSLSSNTKKINLKNSWNSKKEKQIEKKINIRKKWPA